MTPIGSFPGTTRPQGTALLSGEEPAGQPPNPGLMESAPEGGEQQGANTPALGFWLDGKESDVAKDIDERWNAQNKAMKGRFARWDLNERRMDGDTYSKLVQDTDQDTFRVYTPENAELAPPSLNKTRDLSNKMVANLLVDPPKFEAEPPSDTDEDIGAAEFSSRALENEAGESGLDLVGRIEEAEDLACIYGSTFQRFYVDPSRGGRRPKEIMASAAATTVDDALFVTAPPAGAPDLPETPGDTPDAAQPEPQQVAQPAPYFLRYVRPDGALTDDPSEADIEWTPKIVVEVLTGRNLRFLPETCTGIEDADGVLIAAYTTLGALKSRFPKTVGVMDEAGLKSLVSYRPHDTKKLLPKWAGDGQGSKRPPGHIGPPDDAQVCTITGYLRGCPEYQKGAYVCMAGGKFLLERLPWETTLTVPKDKKSRPIPMDLPVSQYRQFRDAKGQDPYGRGLVDLVGDGDPIVAFIIGSVIEYLHRVNNPHLFVPVGSVHENYVGLPRGVPIPYNASAGGKPEYEQFGSLPPEFMELKREINASQDSMSGLQQAAQGTSDPNSQSGIAKQIVVEQALVALGKPKRAMDKAGIRSCRIILQLMRQAYTTPQKMRIPGEDGSFKEEEWTAADLGSTLDVRILPGTSTMLPASAKQDLILRYATPVDPNQPPILSMAEAKRLIRTGVRSIIGMQDSKALLRVKGQVKRWNDGPPDGWQMPEAPIDPATGQPPIDPMTGQPVPAPPDPANPFADQRPTDDEPENAQVRHTELSDLITSSAYRKWGDAWGQYALMEYTRAKQAAGVMTLAEQAVAQQQAAAQQQEAAAGAQATEHRAKAGQQADQHAHDAGQRDAERAHEGELAAMKEQGQNNRTAAQLNTKTAA